MKKENLYDFLDNRVKKNVKINQDFLKGQKQAKDYRDAKERKELVTKEVKAYYYYKYFMNVAFAEYLKNQIDELKDLNVDKAKTRPFFLEVYIDTYTKKEVDITMFYQRVYCSFKDPVICDVFMDHVKHFAECCGINKENNTDRNIFVFKKISINDMLKAYYEQLGKFDFTDELIDTVQEDENTLISSDELAMDVKKR